MTAEKTNMHYYHTIYIYIYIYIYKEDELGMIQFENIEKDSYKSPGVLNIWYVI